MKRALWIALAALIGSAVRYAFRAVTGGAGWHRL